MNFDNIMQCDNCAVPSTAQFKFLSLKVFRQLDSKFICCLSQESHSHQLFIFDQHAVHERVCLERIQKFHIMRDNHGELRIRSSFCHPPLKMKVSTSIYNALKKQEDRIHVYGLKIHFLEQKFVKITSIPACLTTKIFKVNNSKLQYLLHKLMEEISSNIFKSNSPPLIPKTIENILSSIACRGAIKFGDSLTRKQASQLIKSLESCEIPFQCAHGRPSLTTLLNLKDFTLNPKITNPKPSFSCLLHLP